MLLEHDPELYFDLYHENLTENEAYDMLVRAVIKYVEHAVEKPTKKDVEQELYRWFEYDQYHKKYFHFYFEGYLEDGDQTINNILDDSGMF